MPSYSKKNYYKINYKYKPFEYNKVLTLEQLKVWGLLFVVEIFFLLLSLYKEAGSLFAQISLVIIPMTFIACFVAAYIGANQNVLYYVAILLNYGFLTQMFSFKGESLKSTLWKLAFAFVVAFIAGFIYYKMTALFNITAIVPVIMTLQFMLCGALILFGTFTGDKKGDGAQVSLSTKFISFQPLTIVLVLYVFVLAILYDNKKEGHMRKILGLSPDTITLIYTAILCGLMLLCRETGTMVVLLITGAVFMFIFSENRKLIRQLSVISAVGLMIITAIVIGFHDNNVYLDKIYDRFAYMYAPERDAVGADAPGAHSLMLRKSMALGQVVGPDTDNYLVVLEDMPEIDTDMVVAYMTAQCGVLFTLILILVFALLIWQLYRIARKSESKIAMGIAILLGVQTLIHIASNTNLCPIVGIPLPFVSRSFTSVTMSLIMIAIMMVISSRNDERDLTKEEALNEKIKKPFGVVKNSVIKFKNKGKNK